MSVVHDITELRRVEDALRREHQRTQSYLDLAEVMLVAVDGDGIVTMANRKACDVLEREESDLVGSDWFELAIPAEVREAFRARFREQMNSQIAELDHFQKIIVTGAGDERLISWNNAVLRDADGVVVGRLSSGEDVTERNRAEQALCDSEERYRLLVQSAYDAVFVHELAEDGSGRLLEANDRACELLGYTHAELLALTISDIDTILHEQRPQEPLEALLDAGHAIFETVYTCKSGAEVAVEVSTRLLELHGRRMVLSVARDITERRLAEKAVREAEERYRSIFEESPVALWEEGASGLVAWLTALREEGVDDLSAHLTTHPLRPADMARLIEVVRVNHASLRIFAAASEEELIREWTSCLTEEAYEVFAAVVGAFAQGATSFTARCPFACLDGERRILDLSVGLLAAAGGASAC